MNRRFLSVLWFLSIFVIIGFSEIQAFAEKPFPSKRLTYQIFFDPGGPSDREARRQQPLLKRIFGQPVIIEYKIGAGGALGWKEFAKKARADGHTFAGFNLPNVILQPMLQDVGYKTADFEPVALFQRTPLALIVLKESPITTLADFVQACKADPGKMTVGGSGIFSGAHVSSIQLEKLADIKLSYIQFTGSAPQMSALLAGHTEACFANSDDVVRFKDKLRVLAFATEERFFSLPEIPTFKELGYDLVFAVERGVCVPAKTPKEIVKRLEKVFLEVLHDKNLQEQMRMGGSIPLAMGSEETRVHMENLARFYEDLTVELKK